MQMLSAGISFKNTPVQVREKISFNAAQVQEALLKLSEYAQISEVVILSTCNRTEFYLITSDLDQAQKILTDFLLEYKNISNVLLDEYFESYFNKFAAEHLYRVISGIESQVIGENEILSQVKDAFLLAQELGTTGKIFNALFRFAIETGKRVRTETTICRRRISVGSLVADAVADEYEDLSDKGCLIIGAGKVSEVVIKNLLDRGLKNIYIANRTFEKAQVLAETYGLRAIKYAELPSLWQRADIIITGTGAPEPLITTGNFRPEKKVLLIDISIPRNIDPGLKNTENVHLLDLDSLENLISVNLAERKELIHEAEKIIYEDMNKFIDWFNKLEVNPVISSLSALFEDIRQKEVSKTLKKHKIDEDTEKVIDIVTKSILNRIIHYPVANLKLEENKEKQKQLTEDLSYLFQLDAEDEYQKYFRKKSVSQKNKESNSQSEDSAGKTSKCPFSQLNK